ncbi:MAG: hypothetical protein GF401_10805 [Chitinivibrionales bacterium]|nr:hypothetical protein [Chitinivibrionales bacterium]
MIIVTGMHRSGTSCISGLLEKCGLSLGTSHPIHDNKHPTNPKGHFENLQTIAINETILKHAGGTWCTPPPHKNIATIGQQVGHFIQAFSKSFNGDIVKDPRTCLTIDVWEQFCPSIEKIVFCLRNPLAVAKSLNSRDGIPMEIGLGLWFHYVTQFFQGVKKAPVIIVEYDNLADNFEFEFSSLISALNIPLSQEEMLERTSGFYEKSLNHGATFDELYLSVLPPHIRDAYKVLKKRTFSTMCTTA